MILQGLYNNYFLTFNILLKKRGLKKKKTKDKVNKQCNEQCMQLCFRKLNGNQSTDFLNQNKHALSFRLFSHLSHTSHSITVATIASAG